MAPSSAASERVFSLVKTMFGKDQITSMADFIQGSLMLRYNQRRVGRRLQADVSSSPAAGLRPDVRRDAPHARHGRRPHRAARRARPAQRPQAGAPRPTCRAATCPALNALTRARRSLLRGGEEREPSAGRHAERHVSPRGSSTVHGYGSVDPGSADRWRNAQVSRKYAPFVLARRAAQISKNFGRKSGPPKFR